MAELSAEQLTVITAGQTLLNAASFALSAGELVAVIGPNGAGKTTLLRAALGLQALTAGSAWLGDLEAASLTAPQRALRVAYLPQQRSLAWPLTVRDVVALGRYAYGVGNGRLGASDARAIQRALDNCHLAPLAERRADTLSGGELARMHCARTFASDATVIVADEPIAALDPRHQLAILQLLRRSADSGRGVLVVLHDLALAARFADRLLWLKEGCILADGPPVETLTPERIADVFSVSARVRGTQVELLGPIEEG